MLYESLCVFLPAALAHYVNITVRSDGNLNNLVFLKIYTGWELLTISADYQNLLFLYVLPATRPYVRP